MAGVPWYIRGVSAKSFNTAGPCDPERHYMLPPERRLGDIDRLIDGQGYFVLHAPRQAGKTTAMRALAERLSHEERYAALWVSCESAGVAGDDVALGVGAVVRKIAERARELPAELRPPEIAELGEAGPLNLLDIFLHRWAERCPKPIVLLLDEFDALLGKTLIAVLQQLRSGYPERPTRFPQCVGSVVRCESSISAFGYKIDSVQLPNFDLSEVTDLYGQHQKATGQNFPAEALDRIFELTQGHPWLVNALARRVSHDEQEHCLARVDWDTVDRAKENLIRSQETHLSFLAALLQEPRVARIVGPFIAGDFFDEHVTQDDLDYLIGAGLFRLQGGSLVVANPIYREIIPRFMSAVFEPIIDRYLAAISRVSHSPEESAENLRPATCCGGSHAVR